MSIFSTGCHSAHKRLGKVYKFCVHVNKIVLQAHPYNKANHIDPFMSHLAAPVSDNNCTFFLLWKTNYCLQCLFVRCLLRKHIKHMLQKEYDILST